MKKYFVIIFLFFMLLFSVCKKNNFTEGHNYINDVLYNCIPKYFDSGTIDEIDFDWGYYENIKNITDIRVYIVFNYGFYNKKIINSEIENKIINELHSIFSIKNKVNFKHEDINILKHYPFKFIFKKGNDYSEEFTENIGDQLFEIFNIPVSTIKTDYCFGYIEDNDDKKIEIDELKIFLENYFWEIEEIEI